MELNNPPPKSAISSALPPLLSFRHPPRAGRICQVSSGLACRIPFYCLQPLDPSFHICLSTLWLHRKPSAIWLLWAPSSFQLRLGQPLTCLHLWLCLLRLWLCPTSSASVLWLGLGLSGSTSDTRHCSFTLAPWASCGLIGSTSVFIFGGSSCRFSPGYHLPSSCHHHVSSCCINCEHCIHMTDHLFKKCFGTNLIDPSPGV